MKSTGIVRKVDELGRVVLPKELRRTLNINKGDAMEIYVEGDRVILRKYCPECVICGTMDGVETINTGVKVCHSCRNALSEGRNLLEMRRERAAKQPTTQEH